MIYRRISLSYLALFSCILKAFSRVCNPSDFYFEYTNCDELGKRWRVAVPNDEHIECDGGSPMPVRGINCSFSCPPGMYLDTDAQNCRYCSPGSYSLGGGVRFDEFSTLPPDFVIENFDPIGGMSGDTEDINSACSKEAGWILKNSELLYIPSPCVSKLTYTAELVRPGYVHYSYKLPANLRGLSLKAIVKNKQCRSYTNNMKLIVADSNRITDNDDDQGDYGGEWQHRNISLQIGTNIITWMLFSNRDILSSNDVITISKIDIFGLAFTRHCTLCPVGTFSSHGARQCKLCEPGYFSTKGSPQCAKCPVSQYSGAKAAKCTDRPPCTREDYFSRIEKCDTTGMTRKFYEKVQPSVCRDDLDGSFKLPPPSHPYSCPKCNPGMAMNEKRECVFCPIDHYSDGNDCRMCPLKTLPSYGVQYILWNDFPPKMSMRCEYMMEDRPKLCNVGNLWIPGGDSIYTAPTNEKGIVFELILNISGGFHNPLLHEDAKVSVHNPLAYLILEFETICADTSCVFYVAEVWWKKPNFQLVAGFNGTSARHYFVHPIVSTKPVKFLFAFMRSRSLVEDDDLRDHAIIYTVNVTNVAKGGASVCLPCPLSNGKCVTCPPGQYISEEERSCQKCPSGTVLNISTNHIGEISCIQCGLNLESFDGTRCSSSGSIHILNHESNETVQFNLTHFKGKAYGVAGVKVFSSEGSSYFHIFNISLFDEGGATCKDTSLDFDAVYNRQAEDTAQAYICRITAFPEPSNQTSQKYLYMSPVIALIWLFSLGTKLLAITTEKEYDGIRFDKNESVDQERSQKNSRIPELNFFYVSSTATDHCPNGIHTIITMRCDPRVSERPEIHLPQKCPDGTCDGCLYNMIIVTDKACPICTEKDYKVIRSECINGRLTVHSIPARHCVLSGIDSKERVEICISTTFHLQLLVSIAVCATILLSLIVLLVCKKNRRLEYKYMKLIESNCPSKGEIPGAESCGIESDDDEEEDQDRVIFAKGKTKLFRGHRNNRRVCGGLQKRNDGQTTPFVPLQDD